jgi:hypothetical protein
MSNVVQFLETLARNPKPLSPEEFAAAVVNAELDTASQQALLAKDANALNRVLGGRPTMMCLVAPAENDEPQDDEQPDGDEEAPQSEASIAA